MKYRFGLRRRWTAAEADQWTREDAIAAILAVFSFTAIAVGTPYAFLLQPIGFLLLVLGVSVGGFVLWFIGPKLDAVSAEFEKRQRKYLENLERIMRWEDTDG
jgi:hypothetical protein